jgi:hypothetical protein
MHALHAWPRRSLDRYSQPDVSHWLPLPFPRVVFAHGPQIIAKGVRNAYATVMTEDDMIVTTNVGDGGAEHIFRFSGR